MLSRVYVRKVREVMELSMWVKCKQIGLMVSLTGAWMSNLPQLSLGLHTKQGLVTPGAGVLAEKATLPHAQKTAVPFLDRRWDDSLGWEW